jgi:hypothetical protein
MKVSPLHSLNLDMRRACLRFAITAGSLALAGGAIAEPQLNTWIQHFPPLYVNTQNSTTTSTLNDSASGMYSSMSTHASYGSATLVSSGAVPADPSNPGFGASGYGQFVSRMLFHSPGQTGGGIARVTFHLSGNYTAQAGGSAFVQNGYQVNINNNVYGATIDGHGNLNGTPPDSLRTFTVEYSFGFDTPLEANAVLSVGSSASAREDGGCSASYDFTLSMGEVRLMDNQGNPFNDYTADTTNGSARAMSVAQGQPYNSFSLTNTGGYGVGTTVTLLDGVAPAAGAVTAGFIGSPANVQLASDAVALSGTGSNPVVIQMDYPTQAISPRTPSVAGLRLAALDPAIGHWTNAVIGNNGGMPQFVNRAYNPATDFAVGKYGLDTTNRKAWAVVNRESIFAVANVPDALVITSLVSRKTHGGSGVFDIPLSLSGTGVECRSGGAGGNYTLVFTFANDLTAGDAAITSGTATISGAPVLSGNTMTVNLTGVSDAQRVAVTLSDVQDVSSQTMPNTAVNVGFLVGDTSGNGSVTASDIGQAKGQSGQAVSASNFRSDVNASGGTINASDIGQVKANAGHSLP